MNTLRILLVFLILIWLNSTKIFTQSSCNIQASICTPGVSTSFPFISSAAGPPFDFSNPQGCGTGEHGSDFGYGFVLLHITTSGPLNLQIMGNVPLGHLDFVLYNIPIGMDPCTAVLDSSNQIACNFSTQSVGCTQFGYECTGCPSIVAAPYVYSGQQVMIITHDYDNVLSSFTIELCTGIGGAETGAFDATIMLPPVLTDTSAAITLNAATGGGSWSASCGGCINASTGLFNPQNAGVGFHEVIYQVGNAPCTGTDTVMVEVQPFCQITIFQGNDICENSQNTFVAAHTLGNFPVQYIWSTYPSGTVLQLITADSTTNMFNSSDTIFNISTGTYILEIITSDGCQNSAFINVEITPVLDSSFTYSNSLYCENGSIITPNFIANPSSTHFYSSSTDILVDSLSGIINLGITNPGVYTIFNQPNICSGIASFEIIVDNAEDPSFYLMDTICAFQNPSLVLPYDSIVTVGSGHFWSDNEDLNFIDTVTGLVDWKTAKKDTITTIYYNTGGYCSEIDSAKVYVKQLNSFFSYENYTLCTFEVNNIFPDSIHTQTGNLLTSYFYCPDPNLVLDSVTGEIDVDLSPLGQYQVFRVVNDECLDTTRRNITITNYFDPYFTYPVTQICQFEGILAPDTVRYNGGEFTATPAGLSIDDESGEIDLNFSNFGIYTIQYITPSDCGDTAYFTIEVLEVPNSAFSYTDTLFCDMTGTLLPTFVGSVGGVFSSPTGLIVNSATGEIDFDNSHHGSHLIIYTTTGVCTAFTMHSLVVSNTASASFSYSQPSFCGNLGSIVPNMLASTGGNFTATPGGLVINSLTGVINLNASLPNNYTIRYVSAGQCKDTAYFNLEVLPVPSSDFGYVSYAFCDAAATGLVLPSYINTPGGTFTSTPGIILNSVTGEIDLDASTNGVYPISYTTTGICPSTTVRNFTVGVTPVAAFSYASTSFCKNEPNPFPNFISVPGGTFTSSSSSLYVQNSTGMIYLNYSFPGTYTITYTTPGLCNSSSTFTVTINAAPITTFSYPQNYYCSYNGIKSPNVMPSISGGVFNSTAGLDLNTTTGAIDFSTSTPGTYIITYTTPGICPTTSSYTMNVHPTICDCSASLPIFEAYLNGVLVDINDLNVCYGDTLEIISQLGSTWSPHPIYPGSTVPYSPQLSMDVYHCPPSVFAPADLYTANSCFAGETLPQVGHSWTIVNDTANFQPYVNSIDDTTLYLVPHTMYNSATVTVFNPALGNRCYAIDTITVNLLPTIRATYLENCLDSSVVFSFDGGLPSSNGSAYSISTILPTTATVSPLLPIQNEPTRLFPIDNGQDYSLTVNDDAGCWADFAYTNFTGTPISIAGVDSTFCDLTGTLYANVPNFGYGYWTLPNFISVSDTSLNNTTFNATQSGVYSLIWNTESNPLCQNSDTIVLVISDLSLQTSITNTYCFAMQGAIEIEALGGIEPYSFSINNGITHQTSSSFQNLSEGPYVIWVSDSSNCYVTENNVIGLTDDCVLIFYTGITPNNDNLNDVWFIEGLPPGNNPVVIFNRWGDIVWQTENYDNWNNPWKGENMEGKELPVGVYFYNAKVGEVDFSGFIELTR